MAEYSYNSVKDSPDTREDTLEQLILLREQLTDLFRQEQFEELLGRDEKVRDVIAGVVAEAVPDDRPRIEQELRLIQQLYARAVDKLEREQGQSKNEAASAHRSLSAAKSYLDFSKLK